MRLVDLAVYNDAMHLGEQIWTQSSRWPHFAKNTIGNQWVRAIDSVAANLSEGFGRFHFKENKQFCFYARGSLFESQTWLVKAHSRQLIDDATFLKLQRAHTRLIFILNRYIQSIGSTHSP